MADKGRNRNAIRILRAAARMRLYDCRRRLGLARAFAFAGGSPECEARARYWLGEAEWLLSRVFICLRRIEELRKEDKEEESDV